jgi:hypothetical protein
MSKASAGERRNCVGSSSTVIKRSAEGHVHVHHYVHIRLDTINGIDSKQLIAIALADQIHSEQIDGSANAHEPAVGKEDSESPTKSARIPQPGINGEWITQNKTLEKRGRNGKDMKIGSLRKYRSEGDRSPDGLSGIDSQGWHWKKEGTKPNEEPMYFLFDEK